MKRKLLSIAVAAAAVAPLSTFAAGPTVYGRLDLSTEYESRDVDQAYFGGSDDFDSSRWLVRSNSSRIGVKGDAPLSGGLKAVYLAEWGYDADMATKSSTSISYDPAEDDELSTSVNSEFSGRNAYAGLQGEFGTVLLGRKDTPLKEAQGKVDLFNDTIADIQYYFGGEERASNAIAYASPLFSKAFQFNFMLIEQEEWEQTSTGAEVDDAKNGPVDSFSTSLTYTEGSNYFAAAYDNEVSTKWNNLGAAKPAAASGTPFGGSSAPMETFRLVGQFGLDSLTLGAMFETSDCSIDDVCEDLKGSGFLVNAAFKLDTRNSLKIQLAQSKTENDDTENKMSEVALGWDNKMSDTSKLYALLAQNKSEISDEDADAEGSQMNLAVGIQHNF